MAKDPPHLQVEQQNEQFFILGIFSFFSRDVIQGPTYRFYGFRRKFSNLEKFSIVHTLRV